MKRGLVNYNATTLKYMDASDIPNGIRNLHSSNLVVLNNAQKAALSPNGRYFAVAMNGYPYVYVFDLTLGQGVVLDSLLSAGALDCHFSPDSGLLAVGHFGTSGRFLSVYNTSTWVRDVTTPNFSNDCNYVRFDPTGSYLAISTTASPYLVILNVGSWTTVSGTPSVGSSGDLSWSSDGTKLAQGYSSSPYLRVYNVSNWSTISGTPTLSGIPSSLTFSPNGNYLAYTELTSTLRVYLTSDWSYVFGDSSVSKQQISFTSDSVYLAVVNSSSLKVYQTSDWTTNSGNDSLLSTSLGVFFGDTLLSDLSGVVSDINTNLYATSIRLYSRTSGQLIDTITSNASGQFSFTTYLQGPCYTIAICPTAQEGDFNDHILRGVLT